MAHQDESGNWKDKTGKFVHAWSYLDELGPDWEICDVCGKAREIGGDGRLMSYEEALAKARGE